MVKLFISHLKNKGINKVHISQKALIVSQNPIQCWNPENSQNKMVESILFGKIRPFGPGVGALPGDVLFFYKKIIYSKSYKDKSKISVPLSLGRSSASKQYTHFRLYVFSNPLSGRFLWMIISINLSFLGLGNFNPYIYIKR